ncbi:MAG TPA: hypothetical protein DIT76_04655 [Spartobacteria bacterium]|nr:hypothetical protein [Spartobacteria bacterium]HCP91325.1 hypothetical protein [Spartobacteria bacterium]
MKKSQARQTSTCGSRAKWFGRNGDEGSKPRRSQSVRSNPCLRSRSVKSEDLINLRKKRLAFSKNREIEEL